MKYWIALFFTLLSTTLSAAPDGRMVQTVSFSKEGKSATLIGRIKGYDYIDYLVPARAGQTLKVSLKGSHRANYFNLLPPNSSDVAMVSGEWSHNQANSLLPDDGIYTIRVFLIRAAARRNETSHFSLAVSIDGQALGALTDNDDSLVPKTRYHAQSQVQCRPPYSQLRVCDIGVIRRGRDGTATVELTWEMTGLRRILFVKGQPVSTDTTSVMSVDRNEHGWRVSFDGDESYEIPEAIVFGG